MYLNEGSEAVLAGVRSNAGVSSFMTLQVALAGEALLAVLTLVRLLAGVLPYVHLLGKRRIIGTSALRTVLS